MLIKNLETSPFRNIVTFIGDHVIYVDNPKSHNCEEDYLNIMVHQFMNFHMSPGRNYFVITNNKNSFTGMNDLISWANETLIGSMFLACQSSPEGWAPITHYIYLEEESDEVAFKLNYSGIKPLRVEAFIAEN